MYHLRAIGLDATTDVPQDTPSLGQGAGPGLDHRVYVPAEQVEEARTALRKDGWTLPDA